MIDPTCDIDQSFMKVARDNDLAISKVIDTHLHADHVSGLARLAKGTGAQPYISSFEGSTLTTIARWHSQNISWMAT